MPNPPKPTSLKVMDGSARLHPERMNPDEPSLAVGGEPPAWLPPRGEARRAWERIYPIVVRMRVMTPANCEMLAIGCMALRDYLAIPFNSKDWRKRNEAQRAYVTMLREFGMTPSARTRVKAERPEHVDPVEDWAKAQ
jgi:phage terminase small subunit